MVSPLNPRHRLKKKIIETILLYTLYSILYTPFVCAQSSNYVRVAIINDEPSLSIKIKGLYQLTEANGEKILAQGKNLKATITVSKGDIRIGNMNFNREKIFIQTSAEEITVLNGRKFRGHIQLIKNKDAQLSVVNWVELEDYVKGISVRETSHYWPKEALKAQAIVFRTFALYQMQENKSKDYDLTSDIYSQVYGGKTSERYRINKAVDETRNYVLAFEGKVFPTFYHATCAGSTEDASILWKIDIAPLKGVGCNFCKDSPHVKWQRVFREEELKSKLAKAGYPIKKLKDIIMLDRDNSGRIIDLKIITDKKDIRILAKDFRNIVGPNLVRSTNFTVEVIDSDIVFEGFGWGHGVGLCQWGSYFMARQGYTYQEILEYYYPGSEISLINK